MSDTQLLDDLPIYQMIDQPPTCPMCGIRTNMYEILSYNILIQVNTCLRSDCGYEFLMMEH